MSFLMKPFNLNTGTAVAFHREFAQFRNFPAWCDEYSNNILFERIRYDEGYIYKALQLNPKHPLATGTLAELYAHIGNENEFFKNLELSISFGITENLFKKILKEEDVYKPFYKHNRFLEILTKYNFNAIIASIFPTKS